MNDNKTDLYLIIELLTIDSAVLVNIYTVNWKNAPKCVLIYSLQNLTDCDKIWHILS